MSTKNTRNGGKYTGSHTTIIEEAKRVCDIIEGIADVNKISLGIIKTKLPKLKGQGRVKITNEPDRGSIKLFIRGNLTGQDIFVYSSDSEKTATNLAKKLRDHQINICFSKQHQT
jgi:hypothetical protein